ncbi:MAG: pyruvate formate lyase-activating protein [Gracilibacteraceae bacterium]|jgi:pyruvate formate lyase activating enzyme|nr:pyruvate formate lyase-activating protein [Gracilibacteraceae bacterium]
MAAREGRIHSFQSLGGADGPGLRYVVFMQGCLLRCLYCHNPDAWEPEAGESCAPEAVVEKIRRCRNYLGEKSGVTVSGGEPLLQWEFVEELFRLLQKEGFHTALDTSGQGDIRGAERVLRRTDLVLCDLKFASEQEYRQYTGGSLRATLDFLRLTEKMRVPLWLRHVVVPGLTATAEQVLAIGRLASEFQNIEKIELLPFKNICAVKYKAMNLSFPLADTPAMKRAELENLQRIANQALRSAGPIWYT